MNDFNKLLDLLNSWDIVPSYTAHEGYQSLAVEQPECEDNEDFDSPVKGYSGFYTVFRFDYDGKFVDMGAYE